MSKMTENIKKDGTKGSWRWGVLLFTILLLIDMVTKMVADAYFSLPDTPDRVTIIPGWIYLCITYNPGIAYGIGGGAPTWAKLSVIAGTGILMLILALVFFKIDKRRMWIRVALVFIVAGGVGNLIDRVYYRVWDSTAPFGVRDMVDLSRFGFAVCNFADFFITGGAVALVVALVFFDSEAIFPMGKYKKMAEEIEIRELEKQAQKQAKKQAKKESARNAARTEQKNG